jgi:virulence factor Mce-like protein
MNKAAPSKGRILAMVAFSLSCFGLLLFLWLSFGGPVPLKPKGYRVQVAFPEATQLATEADVRVAGVPVGKVREKIRDPAGNRTLATIELDREYAPLRADARAVLRQKTLLGETFVELTLGTENAPPVPEGGRLANERVKPTVELDEILDTLDPFTRQAFRTWQQDLGAAARGRGRDLNDAFGSLPDFVRAGGDLTQTLDQEREALRLLVRNTGVVFGALTEREGQLRRLVESQDDVFSSIAAEQEAFAETWRIFPTFLDESRATMARLESFSGKAEPLMRDMQPALRDLQPTLHSLGDLGPDLRRFFVEFDPLIDRSMRSLPATREVLDGLEPVLGELGPFLGELNPMLEYIGVHIHTLSDMFANLGVATSAKVPKPGAGAVGHYLRQFGPQGAETVSMHPQRMSANRGNAYLNPLGVLASPDSARFKVLPAFDCNNAGGEKMPGGTPATPGCRVQKGFPYKDRLTGSFPHAEASDYDPAGK